MTLRRAHDIAQAVSRQLPTTVTGVRSNVESSEICGDEVALEQVSSE
jgi:hypothetical protein